MGKKNATTDAYIAKAAPFARPILTRLRKYVHTGCPEVEETIKWGSPHFDYKGIFCGMAAFKSHVAFGFWKGSLLMNGKKTLGKSNEKAMGQFGCIRSLDDLPSEKTMIGIVRRAAELHDEGVKVIRKSTPRPALSTPAYFKAALRKSPKALAVFDGFSPSHRREYVEWVTEAKTEATRTKRLEAAVAWMAEGKSRNWKYERK
jgi:uncharacterized protein YdeI (YjbR/CyaY-like superfamily)